MSPRLQFLLTSSRIGILLLTLVAGLRAVKHSWNTNFVKTNAVCDSTECWEHGKRLSEIISPSVNPCDDFYEYVCGEWVKQNSLPPYYDEWSIYTQLQLKTFQQVQEILEKSIKQNDNPALVIAKKFHQQCMQLPYFGIVNSTIAEHNVKLIGYFPLITKKFEKKTWQVIHDSYLAFTGESGLFSIFFYSNRETNHEPLISVREILSPFGLIKGTTLTGKQEKSYVKFLTALVKEVIPHDERQVSESSLNKGISAVVSFRVKLYKVKIDTLEGAGFYHPITVGQMNERYKKHTKKEKPTAWMDWIEIIHIYLGYTNTKLAVKDMTISLENKMYFQLLAQLLSTTPDDVIANHIHLYFIERHTELDPQLRSLLMDVIIQNGNLGGKIRYLGNKAGECIAMNEMKETIGKQYVKKYFSERTKHQAKLLVAELKEMMKIQMKESTWLGDRMMRTFKQKIKDMRVVLGHPKYYKDSLKRFKKVPDEALNPIKLEAFYSPDSNTLSVSAVYINPPIFDPSMPYAMRYSGLGQYIGHEMYHAFGPHAIELHTGRTKWEDKIMSHYSERVTCVINKFDNISVQELKQIQPVPRINGYRTVEENMSDLMGLKLAYWTFRKKVWDTQKCEVMPYLTDLSCDQLFFVSFASLSCSIMTTDRVLTDLSSRDYATPRLRVNKATSNFEVFNEIFGCTKMKPEGTNEPKMCDLWK